MTALVVYESMFGNTRDVALAVARGLAAGGPVEVHEVGEHPAVGADVDLLVVGGPTHAFSMTRPQSRDDARQKSADGRVVSEGIGLREWIAELPATSARVRVAVFDTKVDKPITGSAAKGAAKALRKRGFEIASEPEHFLVGGTTGPLAEGELERATAWAAALVPA